jgi:hypothetical protein
VVFAKLTVALVVRNQSARSRRRNDDSVRNNATTGNASRKGTGNGAQQTAFVRKEETVMAVKDAFLTDTVMATLAIYAEMRRRTSQEQAAAEQELRRFYPKLIAQGEANRESMMVKGLTHLRQFESRSRPIPVWMRHRDAETAFARDEHPRH